ncbi:MAG: transposase [Chloroflexi bacterium]|nr:transposase [Chloroflexota bacterium]
MNNQPSERRKSPRKYDYDYTQAGAYFVTICTFQRVNFFGEVVESDMRLNFYGQIASHCWKSISKHFEHVSVDEYIIMPNHMHGILFVEEGNKYLLGNIVGNYKGGSYSPYQSKSS